MLAQAIGSAIAIACGNRIQMAIWTSKFRNPSVEILNLLEPIMSENNSHLDGILEGLREIHLLGQSKDPFWWRALTT